VNIYEKHPTPWRAVETELGFDVKDRNECTVMQLPNLGQTEGLAKLVTNAVNCFAPTHASFLGDAIRKPAPRANEIRTLEELDQIETGEAVELEWVSACGVARFRYISRDEKKIYGVYRSHTLEREFDVSHYLSDLCFVPYKWDGETETWNQTNYLRLPLVPSKGAGA
jgi:hypothetical protein